MAQPEVIFIMGPTAAGKTDLAMQLYDQIPSELISVDSALVYRGMDIGTAKPSTDELRQYPHHLIDICEPDRPYSASKFREDALVLIKDILSRDRLPILVGGSMLYFKTLLDGIADLPTGDDTVREAICREAKQIGWPAMHQQLATFDPVAADRIKPGDSQRIQRAIEVYRLTGKTLTDFHEQQQEQRLPYRVLSIAISPGERTVLRQQIRKRFMTMLNQGFIAEVEYLTNKRQYESDLPALRSVGYRQVVDYLNGIYDYDTMIEKAVVATARLAKRQLTWLRSWPDVIWLESGDESNVDRVKTLL